MGGAIKTNSASPRYENSGFAQQGWHLAKFTKKQDQKRSFILAKFFFISVLLMDQMSLPRFSIGSFL